MIGLYVHIPFCVRKCPYCDFYSIPHDSGLEVLYTQAVVADMNSYKGKGFTADTLYFGGGTPILMSAENLSLIIETAFEVFSADKLLDITIEANPNSTTREKLLRLKAAGVNRISFGMQSANERELSALGRLHDNKQAISAIYTAYEVGIDNISVDIMLGTPYQTKQSLRDTIEIITALPISHISAYMLKIEEGTPYFQSELLNYCAEEDTLADLYLEVISSLAKKGFSQYEISNFAKDGKISAHNLKYWHCEEYLGFGASAHSFLGNTRYFNKSSVTAYIEDRGKSPLISDSNAGGLDEYIMMGLRLNEGINLNFLKAKDKQGIDYQKFIGVSKKFCDSGYADIKEGRMSLTPSGFLLSNTIIANLLEAIAIYPQPVL